MMSAVLDTTEYYFNTIIELSTILLELFGVIILVYTAIRCFILWFCHSTKIRLDLAQGIALSLEFKMGSEVLRTVIVREWAELGILGAVIILRGLLTFLIQWEIRHEEAALKKEE